MNKVVPIVILALSFIAVKSEFGSCTSASSPSEDNCRILSTSTDKTHCCYIELNGGNGTCKELSDDAYENIKRYKDYLKNSYEKVKIKCSSEFNSLTLISLFSLLAIFALLF